MRPIVSMPGDSVENRGVYTDGLSKMPGTPVDAVSAVAVMALPSVVTLVRFLWPRSVTPSVILPF